MVSPVHANCVRRRSGGSWLVRRHRTGLQVVQEGLGHINSYCFQSFINQSIRAMFQSLSFSNAPFTVNWIAFWFLDRWYKQFEAITQDTWEIAVDHFPPRWGIKGISQSPLVSGEQQKTWKYKVSCRGRLCRQEGREVSMLCHFHPLCTLKHPSWCSISVSHPRGGKTVLFKSNFNPISGPVLVWLRLILIYRLHVHRNWNLFDGGGHM